MGDACSFADASFPVLRFDPLLQTAQDLADEDDRWLACRLEEMLRKSARRGESLIAEIRTLLDKSES